MWMLISGLLLFLGAHSLRIVAEPWRLRCIARLGVLKWRALYSLVSLAGLLLLLQGYGDARVASAQLFQAPAWSGALASALMLPALILLAATYVPGTRIKALIAHPMLAAVMLWSLTHLLANGRLADVLLFGAFLAWSVADFVAARARDRRSPVTASAGPWWRDALAIGVGFVAWAALLSGLHGWLTGVPLRAL
jgi:uncharacterized membrane protein